MASITNRSRFDFNETFEVLTGEQPNQKSFTVHRQPFTERSKFLEAASSSRWNSGTSKPVDLTEHKPEVFASYMQCVYHGSVPIPELPNREEGKSLRGLVMLYLLADKLDDTTTANLVIDEMIRASEELRVTPCELDVALVYESTVAGSRLRKLCRDYYVNEVSNFDMWEIHKGRLPFQFLQDVILEFARLSGRCSKVKCVDRDKCYYHQHDDEQPECL